MGEVSDFSFFFLVFGDFSLLLAGDWIVLSKSSLEDEESPELELELLETFLFFLELGVLGLECLFSGEIKVVEEDVRFCGGSGGVPLCEFGLLFGLVEVWQIFFICGGVGFVVAGVD